MKRPTTESEAWRIDLLAQCGFSAKCISKRVFGRDDWAHRVHYWKTVSLRDYRNGKNEFANWIMRKSDSTSATPDKLQAYRESRKAKTKAKSKRNIRSNLGRGRRSRGKD